MNTFAAIIPYFFYLLTPISIAGFALAIPSIRGKCWLTIWALLLIISNLWNGVVNVLMASQWIEIATYSALCSVGNLGCNVAWPFMLLFICEQKAGPPTRFTNIFFSFRGRISRQQFWIGIIAIFSVSFACFSFYAAAMAAHIISKNSDVSRIQLIASVFVYGAWSLVASWCALAIQVKRWHDRGKSGWMVLINLIPLVGIVWALVELGFLQGETTRNAHGDNPI